MEHKKVQGILPGYFVAHLNPVEGDRTDILEWDFFFNLHPCEILFFQTNLKNV